MSLSSQKHLFNLPPEVSYLNHAYMAPLLKKAQIAGREMIDRLSNPSTIHEADFFEPATSIRTLLAELLQAGDKNNFALTPSASYSIANIARQVRPAKGSNIVITGAQFPSNVYAWKRLCMEFDCELKTIDAPPSGKEGRGRLWNEAIQDGIDAQTCLISLGPLHWSDGTLFDLAAIRARCDLHSALMIIDASQAACAMPINIDQLRPDALVCAGYKWLIWPYGTGMAWFGSFFEEGTPFEENWIVHEDADDFSRLLYYNENLIRGGQRYSSGEHPAMIHTAMQRAALEQIREWGVESIYTYASGLADKLRGELTSSGLWLESPEWLAKHLFGIYFASYDEATRAVESLRAAGVIVSQRGNAIRISLYMYNDENDVDKLVDLLKDL